MQTGKIFISYRRDDSFITARKIFEQLEHYYGRDSLCMDIDPIPIKPDATRSVNKELFTSDIILVIIGPNWLPILQEKADDPDDSVRLEIEAALHQDLPIIPVYLGDRVNSLKASDLMAPLSELSTLTGFIVDPGSDLKKHLKQLRQEIDRCLATLERNTASASPDLDGSKPPQGNGDAEESGAVDTTVNDTAERTRQEGKDEAWAADESRLDNASNLSGPEAEFEADEASVEWDEICSDLENGFGQVLSDAERLETERERFAESEGEIELEFELHDLEEEIDVGQEGVPEKDDDHEPEGQVDLSRFEDDTLVLDTEEVADGETLVLNTDEVTEGGTLVLNANEVTEGGTLVLNSDEIPVEGESDPADTDRFPEADGTEPDPKDNLLETPRRRIQEASPPEEKQIPLRKNFKLICAAVMVVVITVVLGGWLLFGGSENSDKMSQRHTMQLSVSGLESSFVENEAAGRLLVLKGLVHNRSSSSQKLIQIEGSTYAKGEVLIQTELAVAGLILTDEELKTLPLKEIHKKLNDASGHEEEIIVDPAQRLPFMVVLGEQPDNLNEFTVSIARSAIAAE